MSNDREVGRFHAGGRSLHALRHVLHDQMPLCAAASFHARFSPSDAAPPRRRAERRARTISPSASWPRWTATARLARFASPVINWASDTSNKPMRALMEKTAGISIAKATLPKFHSRTFVSAASGDPIAANQPRRPSASAKPRSMPPALSITTSPSPAWRRARCSIISAWKPKSPIPAAAACRSWNKPNLARVARKCRQGFQGIGQAD